MKQRCAFQRWQSIETPVIDLKVLLPVIASISILAGLQATGKGGAVSGEDDCCATRPFISWDMDYQCVLLNGFLVDARVKVTLEYGTINPLYLTNPY